MACECVIYELSVLFINHVIQLKYSRNMCLVKYGLIHNETDAADNLLSAETLRDTFGVA